ncbi:acyl transferase/acyl hydrolase/lysophospholipase [Dichotomopilus funicola]|uniref:Patatin-like phospholipase domain-containing protein n=1 Tax=Dichotomopilus funicola TaxID=1934379 RepID=A0AAN6V125_9PEZI|nr:acyl transferase/acyl hydrolase/lysophospholipase [Dichotomopilus funicola]
MPDLLVHRPHGVQTPAAAEAGAKAPARPDQARGLRRRKKSQDHGQSHVVRLARSVGNLALTWRDGLTASERENKRRKEERKQILAARMQSAQRAQDWEEAACELDELEGNNDWKLHDTVDDCDYDPGLIRASMEALDAARENCDISAMMYLIRTALSRDIGGMGNVQLYRNSYLGTKALIECYVDSAVKTVDAAVNMAVQTELHPRELLEGMIAARQSFGRSALLLSGGATFGMAHIGVLKTLYEQQLLPRIMSGASAGSIVCAVLCTRKDDEVPDLIRMFPFGDLGVFEGEKESLMDHMRNLLTTGSWSDITNLTRVMRSLLGDVTFQEAYNRTRRICNICVSSASIYDVPRLLNYITAPNVIIWSAVAASCSVPMIFQGHPLLMKDPDTGAHAPWIPTPQQFIDGSVENDLPMTRLAEMFNVNHFIVSQVNPHVIPFLPRDEHVVPGQLGEKKKSIADNHEWLYNAASVAREEGAHRMQYLADLGIFPNLLTKLLSVMSQKYSGDINILPEIALSDIPLMLKNPTPSFMLRNCLVGERATWPKLSRIRDRLAIELALDQAVHDLRARVVFSRSQVNLRRAMGVWEPMTYRHPGAPDSPRADSSGAFLSVQHSSGEATPSEERSFGRRRGSGASIQLVAARHKKPFFHVSNDDDMSDEDDSLEFRVRPSRAKAASTVTSLTAGRGGSSSASGSGNGGLRPPRLKRNAKSQGFMRGGRPVSQPEVYTEFGPRGPLLPTDLQAGDQLTDLVSGFTQGDAEAGLNDSSATTATAVEGGDGSTSSDRPSSAEAKLMSSDTCDQMSEGLQSPSDTDPYAEAAEFGHSHGSKTLKREESSKLRYSDP